MQAPGAAMTWSAAAASAAQFEKLANESSRSLVAQAVAVGDRGDCQHLGIRGWHGPAQVAPVVSRGDDVYDPGLDRTADRAVQDVVRAAAAVAVARSGHAKAEIDDADAESGRVRG